MQTGWVRPDPEALEAVYDLEDDDDVEMLVEVVDMFVADGLPRLQRLGELCAGDDTAAVAELAHALKSSFGNVGLPLAAEHCERLVQGARAGDLTAVHGLAADTLALCAGLEAGLAAFLAEL
ncbi:MAG: Hpt domain-containing protein [Planctomycetota bacterium]